MLPSLVVTAMGGFRDLFWVRWHRARETPEARIRLIEHVRPISNRKGFAMSAIVQETLIAGIAPPQGGWTRQRSRRCHPCPYQIGFRPVPGKAREATLVRDPAPTFEPMTDLKLWKTAGNSHSNSSRLRNSFRPQAREERNQEIEG